MWSDVKTAFQMRVTTCAHRAFITAFGDGWTRGLAPVLRQPSYPRTMEEVRAHAAAKALYAVNDKEYLVYEDGSSWEAIRHLHESLQAFHLFFDDVARHALALEVLETHVYFTIK